MNKANALLIAAVLTATSLAQAKDYHLVVKPSTGKASAFWGNTEVFVDGSAQHDTITMLKDGKIGEFEASSLQEFCLLSTFAQL